MKTESIISLFLEMWFLDDLHLNPSPRLSVGTNVVQRSEAF